MALPSPAMVLSTYPIRAKLTLIIVGICMITFLLTSLVQMAFGFFNERKQLVSRLMTTANVVALQTIPTLEFQDPVSAKENLASLRLQPSIVRACIFSKAGLPFASYNYPSVGAPPHSCPNPRSSGVFFDWDTLSLFIDIVSKQEKIGSLFLEYDLSPIYQNLLDVWIFNTAMIGIAIILAYLLSKYLQQMISRPILELARKTRQFALTHDYRIRAIKYSSDELGELADDFNMMIGEIERHEQELEHAIIELRQSNTELERFAYICSHDLQEPLRMISNYTQMLEKQYGPEFDQNARDYMSFVIDGATRMRQLVNDVLAYSRLSQHKEKPEMVALGEVVDYVLNNLSLTIEEKKALIEVGVLPTVRGHKSLLLQIFQNLLTNALKFCEERPHIYIGAERKDSEKCWVIMVKDNGIGIDPKYHDKVFEIFKRLNRRETYKGTGIGLAICKKAVEHHGGRIWLESTVGKGTTFFFTLPDLLKGEGK